MELENIEVTTPVETPQVAETPAVAPAAKETPTPAQGLDRLAAAQPKEAPLGESEDPGEGETPATPSYKAREKFKVMVYGSDEQKEHEVPAFLKGLMKDEASEKEVISLLEKAYGLEPVKQARAAIAKERDQVRGEFSKIQSTIQDVRQSYQRGDIDAFLEKLAIPQERMLQWALDKVNYSQLPPDQQRVLDERKLAERRAYAAEQQNMSMEQHIQEQSRQAKQVLLQSSLTRPDVNTFAQSFDTQAGKAGAFFEEVRATGELAWIQSNGKVDLTPDQAVEQVMNKWRKFLPAATASVPGTQPAPQAAAPVIVNTPKPAVIPNVQGRSSSPMKAGVRSLDDLRKLSAQKSS